MLGRTGLPGGGGVAERREVAAGAVSPPPKLFLAGDGGEEEAVVSPTSTLQVQSAAASPTSPATATAVPFSRRSHYRPWDARPVGLGLAGALAGEASAAAVLTNGQRIRPLRQHAANAPSSPATHTERQGFRSRCLSPRESYTRGGGDEFLRWCHGCSKDLGQGKDIFMYRGERAFCSHECRHREMLRSDQQGVEE